MRWLAVAVATAGFGLVGCAHQQTTGSAENQPSGGFSSEPVASAEPALQQQLQQADTTATLPPAHAGMVWRCKTCCGAKQPVAGGTYQGESVDLGQRENVAGKSCFTCGAASQKQPVAGRISQACSTVRVLFDFDSAKLSDEDKTLLKQSADCLKHQQGVRVSIAGNTDSRGSAEYNFALGQRRAASVAKFLNEQGVSDQQLMMLSFGEQRPLCKDKTESCFKRNRNATIRSFSLERSRQ